MAIAAFGRARSIHYAWIVVAAVFIATVLSAGVRSSFGIYLKPLEEEFYATRASVSLVGALSILANGVIQPLIGHLLDRYGTRTVAICCLLVACLGVLASSIATDLWQLYITFGIVVSAAVGGPATVMAAVVAARWFTKHQGLVMGILAGGFSTGQLIFLPLLMQLNVVYGWRMSYLLLGLGIAVLTVPIGLLIRSDPSDIGKKPFGASESSAARLAKAAEDEEARIPLIRAIRTRGFWMLALTFGICGYSSAGLIGTHFVTYAVERGFDNMTAAAALGVMGVVNTAGTLISGFLTDRVGNKNLLAAIYIIRGLALLFLLVVDDPLKLNLYAVIFGMSYIATVPPTTSLTARLFGRLSVGAIFGVIFMTHQIGGALSSFLTGLIFDYTRSYSIGFLIGAILCFAAAMMAFSIKEQPARKPAHVPSVT